MKKIFLDGKWDLTFTLPDEHRVISTEVEVPCNVEPYLVRLGLIEDYMPADYAFATQRFEAVDDWTYTTHFDAPEKKDGYTEQLVFDGIDTVAEIYLNGEKLLDCENMHLQYRADLTGRLKPVDNELCVVIRSSELYAREHLHDMYSSARDSVTNYDSSSHLRKTRHQWGWDNAPRLITSGIIRSVYLEQLPPKRFDEVYLYTDQITDDYVVLGANWIYQTSERCVAGHAIRITFFDGDEIIHTQTDRIMFVQGSSTFCIPRNKVSLWWPSGFGEPKLYTIRLEILEKDTVAATYTAPFGIRTVRLEWTEDIDENGGNFVFWINGERVYIRGTNWKPLDPLASLADKKLKEGRALEEIRSLNCNMVRIWGGGLYEDEYLFDFCDRNGILVWQDFMFACEVPPTDDAYCELVMREATYIIKKYRNHPSLALWCGDNENDKVMQHKNQQTCALPSDSRISRQVLKKAVLCNDHYRTYLPSSPFVSDRLFIETTKGKVLHPSTERHLYAEIYAEPSAIRACPSFFFSETGPFWANPIAVNKATFQREAERMERIWSATVELPRLRNITIFHQDEYYVKKWRLSGKNACERLLGRDFTFAEFKDYTLALNLLCAEDYKDLIEYCRVCRWQKTGVIWWSLMDMFPMLFNYSVIDSEYNRKLPYYWIQKSQQEFALIGVRKEVDGQIGLYAANDTLTPHTVDYTVTAYGEDLAERVIAEGTLTQTPNSVGHVLDFADCDKPQLWIMEWKEQGRTYYNHVFTKNASYEIMRDWTELLCQKMRIDGEVLELKQLKKIKK